MRPQVPSRSVRHLELGPADLPARIRLATGDALLRSLAPDDADRLIAFFASHTPDTIHERYGYSLREMTPEHARRLVDIDVTRDVALGVFEKTSGKIALIAIGRYCLAEDGQSAEAAFVVHEDRRSQGIGSVLLRTLRNIAAARGVPRLVASVQRDNTPMLAVFRRAGASFHSIEETFGLHAILPVTRKRGLGERSEARGRKASSARRRVPAVNRRGSAQIQTAASRLRSNLSPP